MSFKKFCADFEPVSCNTVTSLSLIPEIAGTEIWYVKDGSIISARINTSRRASTPAGVDA
jgi:hypothetical protein